jgi:adiponectin receptor
MLVDLQSGEDHFSGGLVAPLYIGMGVCYLSGLSIYLARCPERMRPGRFDTCGHSHQIWHLSVIAGIICAFLGTLLNFYQRRLYPSCV